MAFEPLKLSSLPRHELNHALAYKDPVVKSSNRPNYGGLSLLVVVFVVRMASPLSAV